MAEQNKTDREVPVIIENLIENGKMALKEMVKLNQEQSGPYC